MTIKELSEQACYCASYENTTYLPDLSQRAKYDFQQLESLLNSNYQLLLIGSFSNLPADIIAYDLPGNNNKTIYFDSWASLTKVFHKYSGQKLRIFIHLALESADDPLKLTASLKELLQANPESELIYLENLSSPAKSLYRIWSKNQIKTYFELLGLSAQETEYGLNIKYSKEFEKQRRKELFGLDYNFEFDTLEFSLTENPKLSEVSVEPVVPQYSVVFKNLLSDLSAQQIIDHKHFAEDTELHELVWEQTLAIARITSAFFVNLKYIVYPEFHGLGVRIAQAANTLELPPRINTIAKLNGNHSYRDTQIKRWTPFTFDKIIVAEKISVELADHVFCPDEKILSFNESIGIGVQRERLLTARETINGCSAIKFREKDLNLCQPESSLVTLIIPFFRTNIDYVARLFTSLNTLTLKPLEIIIVDDCSGPESAKELQELCNSSLGIPYRILTHTVNRGCANSRNTALAECRTRYLINIDSDDIARPNYILRLLEAVQISKTPIAIPNYARITDDCELEFKNIVELYRPLGDGIIANLRINRLGGSMFIVESCFAKNLGGWQAEAHEVGDDYRLYALAICKGYKISVVPSTQTVYRITPGSLTKTLDVFDGDILTAKILPRLPLFERIRQVAIIPIASDLLDEYRLTVSRLNIANQECHANEQFIIQLKNELKNLKNLSLLNICKFKIKNLLQAKLPIKK